MHRSHPCPLFVGPVHHPLYPQRAQIELKTGDTVRGELHEAEDNFNCQLRNVTATSKVCVLVFAYDMLHTNAVYECIYPCLSFRMDACHIWTTSLSVAVKSGTSKTGTMK